VAVTSFADDITPLSSHHNYHQAEIQLQPYLDKIFEWTQENNLTINPDKCSATLFTQSTEELKVQLSLKLNNITIPTTTNPKILGLTFDRKLSYKTHINNAVEKGKNATNVLKAISSKEWGKQKETLLVTYKAIVRPHLEYASTIWSSGIAESNIEELQKVQNKALRLATGCHQGTNNQHLHDETSVLPISNHLQLHASLFALKTNHPEHPLHSLTLQTKSHRDIKKTIFDRNNNYIVPPPSNQNVNSAKTNHTSIHSSIVNSYLSSRNPNKILNQIPPRISNNESSLPRKTRCLLAQLRSGKSSFLHSYMNIVNPTEYPSPNCPLCSQFIHDTHHLFNCSKVNTNLTVTDLWTNPVRVASLLERWTTKLEGCTGK
jgi:Reverse transcriptase (RNA-dependent DNA polymerase)